jgi:hypothetical protein
MVLLEAWVICFPPNLVRDRRFGAREEANGVQPQ